MRRAMTGLLCAWCVIGALATALALTGPSVWWNTNSTVSGVVGMPLRGAAEVAAIRELLPRDGESRWLVMFPPQSDTQVLTYVRYQLGHLEYPRRVDVTSATEVPSPATYAGVITAPGMTLPLPWRSHAVHGGFTVHTIAGS